MRTAITVLSLIVISVGGKQIEQTKSSVKLSLYYESLCPYCIDYIVNQVKPAWDIFGKRFQVQFKPYGNARYEESGDGWKFRCQHGERECYGNIIQACLINMVGEEEQEVIVPMISCIMSKSPDRLMDAEVCVKESNLSNDVIEQYINRLETCVSGKEGQSLLHDIAVETDQLVPKHKFVPWPLFNGKYDYDNFEASAEDMKSFICANYLMDHPAC